MAYNILHTSNTITHLSINKLGKLLLIYKFISLTTKGTVPDHKCLRIARQSCLNDPKA